MDLATALATATAHGWSDDSAWTRSTVACQVSTQRDGLLAGVTVDTSGLIRWSVSPTEGPGTRRRGTAESIPAAMAACEDAILSLSGTLF